MTTKVTTAWGAANVVDEVALPQRAGDKEFASVVQLLEGAAGERYVRFAYTTGGTARRGPVTLREEDLTQLAEALETHAELREALAPGGDAPGRKRGRRMK